MLPKTAKDTKDSQSRLDFFLMKMPFKRLQHTKPDVAHLRVFGCGAYVFLPEDV